MSTELIVASVFVWLYLAFLFWYGGKSKPLTAVEVDMLLAEIKKRAGKQDSVEEDLPMLQQFRDLTQNDDGREYYMVNLLKFRKKGALPGRQFLWR